MLPTGCRCRDRLGPLPAVGELATLTSVDWFNHNRLLEPIGSIPPAEVEADYYRQRMSLAKAA